MDNIWVQWSLDTAKMIPFSMLFGIWCIYYAIKMQRNSDAEWKKHVKRLRTRGIDPSYIKRSPEWEANLHREILTLKICGIIGVFIVPLFLVIAIVATLIANS